METPLQRDLRYSPLLLLSLMFWVCPRTTGLCTLDFVWMAFHLVCPLLFISMWPVSGPLAIPMAAVLLVTWQVQWQAATETCASFLTCPYHLHNSKNMSFSLLLYQRGREIHGLERLSNSLGNGDYVFKPAPPPLNPPRMFPSLSPEGLMWTLHLALKQGQLCFISSIIPESRVSL